MSAALRGEAQEVVVACDQLFRSRFSISPIERVDEVESRMAGDQLEHPLSGSAFPAPGAKLDFHC